MVAQSDSYTFTFEGMVQNPDGLVVVTGYLIPDKPVRSVKPTDRAAWMKQQHPADDDEPDDGLPPLKPFRKITPLTLQQTNIVWLTIAGLSNKSIARKLTITENTVKVHLKNILEKWRISTRCELAALMIEEGYLELKKELPLTSRSEKAQDSQALKP